MKKLLCKSFYWLRAAVASGCVLLFLMSVSLIIFLPSGTVHAQSTHTLKRLTIHIPTDTPTPTNTPTPTPTNTPTPTPTNTPTPTPTNTPTPTPTNTPTPTPTNTPTPTPTPTDTPTPAPTIPPVTVITVVPTTNVSNVTISPTSQAVIAPGGQQPTPANQSNKPGSPTPTPSAHSTAQAFPYPTNTGTTPDDSATSPSLSHTDAQKSGLSTMILPIAAIAGMVGIAAAALIAIEIRKRQRLQVQQQTNIATNNASSFQQAGAGAFAPYAMQANMPMDANFVAPPSSSGPGMAPFYNQAEAQYNQDALYTNNQGNYDQNAPYQQESYEQGEAYAQDGYNQGVAYDSMPPAMRAAMGEPTSSSPMPPAWMQSLSGEEDPEQNYQTMISNSSLHEQGQNQIADNNTLLQQKSPASLSPSGFHTPEAGLHSQPDPFLEAIMRQAQMGIFALPDKTNE